MKVRNIKLGFVLILFLSGNIAFSQVGIGTVTPNTSAILDVDVTSLAANGKKGFLPPRMTTTERDAIVSPATGLLIYNSTTNILNYYTGSGWTVIDTSTGSFVDLSTPQTVGGDKTFTGTLTPEGRLMLPMGELNFFDYVDGHTLTTTSNSDGGSGNDNMVPINPISSGKTVNFVNDMFTLNGSGSPVVLTPSNSRLEYTSGDAVNPFVGRYFHIALSFSFSSVSGNTGETFVFGVTKNGDVQDSSKQFVSIANAGTHQSSALHVLLWLDDGDEIGFSIGQLTGTGNVVIKSMNFVAIGM